MSEHINNVSKRKEAMKEVIRRLHGGESVDSLKEEFGDAIRGATASEIAEAERALIGEGVTVSEIQRLCDFHVAIFRESLDEEPSPESLPGHPVFTFRMENEVTQRLLESMQDTINSWVAGDQSALKSVRQQADNLTTIEKHYSRKENLLFPYLEKKGFEGPSKVMWGVDNDIRAEIKSFLSAINQPEPNTNTIAEQFKQLAQNINEMIYKEERILFPEALNLLSDSEFAEIRQQEDEIGYFNVTPSAEWQPEIDVDEQTQPIQTSETGSTDLLSLATGALTPKQINLMLTNLPVDVTFVDENDKVRYFTQGRERIFDRAPSIIGRQVSNCHPPQSVKRVEIILDDFRSGERDLAEFWIQMGGKFIHIRYFALRNQAGDYKGCIEVSQDVTEIRALEGEKRLLDDAPGYTE